MTIAVLWYRQNLDQVWCASDSRISRGDATTTDSGPKVLPVPIVCHKHVSGPNYVRSHIHSYGFAFSGSTLAAVSTHTLASACTQNLASAENLPTPPSLDRVAELFRTVSEHYITDMSAHATGALNPTDFFFQAFIYGFCPVKRAYGAFGIAPNIQGPQLKVIKATMNIGAGFFTRWGAVPRLL